MLLRGIVFGLVNDKASHHPMILVCEQQTILGTRAQTILGTIRFHRTPKDLSSEHIEQQTDQAYIFWLLFVLAACTPAFTSCRW
jgi:hypothetical protein